MKRRNILQMLATTAFLFTVPFAEAQTVDKDYKAISPLQPGGANGRVEVIEFFSYGCPHCYEFNPLLSKWHAALPKDVEFRRVPVSFGRQAWKDLGQLYLTLRVMGLSDKLDSAVFSAIHKDRVNLSDEKTRNDWLVKQGVDAAKFNNTWKSFGVASLVNQAESMSKDFRVEGVPSLAIDGKYWAQGENFAEMLKSTDMLIAKARAEKAKK